MNSFKGFENIIMWHLAWGSGPMSISIVCINKKKKNSKRNGKDNYQSATNKQGKQWGLVCIIYKIVNLNFIFNSLKYVLHNIYFHSEESLGRWLYFVACIHKLVFSVSSSSKYSQIIVKYFQKVGGDIVKQVSFINLDIHDITAY